MKLKKYLYKYPQANGSWKYVIQLGQKYVVARKSYEDILVIYEECVACDFDMDMLLKIKEKYDELKRSNPMRYIHRNQAGFYFIQKDYKYFCCSSSLKEILEYKKQLEENGWDKSCLDYKFRKKHHLPKYIQQNKSGTYSLKHKGEHYGTFNNLEDAVEERDLLMENDWNYDFVDLV